MSQSIESKVAAGKACKDKGNTAFSGGNYMEALRSYHEAILFLKGLDAGALQSIVPGQSLEKRIQEEIKTALKACHKNMAACYLKLEKADKALLASEKALALDDKDPKSHFRRGQAHAMTQNYDKAQKDFYKAASLSPQDKGIREDLDKVNAILKESAARSDAEMKKNLAKANASK